MKINPYEAGALNPEFHERLVANLDGYAEDAGILPKWICEPLPDTLQVKERDYIVNFKKHQSGETGVSGLCYIGSISKMTMTVEDRFSAIAGCLVRNFIRARVVTVGTLVEQLQAKDAPDMTCLLIPNFFYSEAEGGGLPKWQVSLLMDFFSYRHTTGKQTIIFATSKDQLKKEYGLNFGQMINNNFLEVGA